MIQKQLLLLFGRKNKLTSVKFRPENYISQEFKGCLYFAIIIFLKENFHKIRSLIGKTKEKTITNFPCLKNT